MTYLLDVQNVQKVYTRGLFSRKTTFSLSASFSVPRPEIIGVLGPNGSGKTTLFELLSGSNVPTSGKVVCAGQDIQRVKYDQRDRLAIHYHQSYQVRSVKKTLPAFMLDPTTSVYPLVHIFDEPQFSTQDGYIGFMLNFFRQLRQSGRVVFLCVHPCESFHLDILRQNCERYLFVSKGKVSELPDWESLSAHPGVDEYLTLANGQR
ncbi:MAG TPA: ATP-binding cassette domain-containing protein [Polyangiaceae bacterium]|nr:ATP-binding cassette domain-containing protein [Polyangiaceae bacterium]